MAETAFTDLNHSQNVCTHITRKEMLGSYDFDKSSPLPGQSGISIQKIELQFSGRYQCNEHMVLSPMRRTCLCHPIHRHSEMVYWPNWHTSALEQRGSTSGCSQRYLSRFSGLQGAHWHQTILTTTSRSIRLTTLWDLLCQVSNVRSRLVAYLTEAAFMHRPKL